MLAGGGRDVVELTLRLARQMLELAQDPRPGPGPNAAGRHRNETRVSPVVARARRGDLSRKPLPISFAFGNRHGRREAAQ